MSKCPSALCWPLVVWQLLALPSPGCRRSLLEGYSTGVLILSWESLSQTGDPGVLSCYCLQQTSTIAARSHKHHPMASDLHPLKHLHTQARPWDGPTPPSCLSASNSALVGWRHLEKPAHSSTVSEKGSHNKSKHSNNQKKKKNWTKKNFGSEQEQHFHLFLNRNEHLPLSTLYSVCKATHSELVGIKWKYRSTLKTIENALDSIGSNIWPKHHSLCKTNQA